MALPNPLTLTTWEEAFTHPLPTTRHLETQLRTAITSNRETLRSLVGTSYRELLGTAERIIEMNEQVHAVEKTLGDVGRKCNARALERVGENTARMERGGGAERQGRGMSVRIRLLQACLKVVARRVRSGGEVLGVAKVLVLARVLCKSVSARGEKGGVVEELEGRLVGARRKVAAYLERVVRRATGERGVLVNALCAYALLTSSTPKEVLRYFLQVRLQRLENLADAPGEEAMLQMLEVYSQTLLDSRDVFPRRFADALGQLAKAPLLQDEQVRSIPELNIDVYGSWIASDIKTFTPWVRHEQLTSTEVSEALASWSNHAQECVVEGLREFLQSQDDARAVVSARQKIVSRYLGLSGKLAGSNHGEAVDGVRLALVEKVKTLAVRAGAVPNVFESAKHLPTIAMNAKPTTSIWDLATKDFDLSHGAVPFRNAILHQRHGRNESVNASIQQLDIWTTNVHAILELIDDMRSSRWDDDIDLDLEDLDDKDVLIARLSKEDPEAVLTSLRDSTLRSIKTLAESVTSADVAPEDAAFHLRVWREIERRRRTLHSRLDLPLPTPNLTHLYRTLSQTVSRPAIEKFIAAAKGRSYIPAKLWDGSPPLPTQPLPTTFRFLVELQKGMGEVGEDLWSWDAVVGMKGVVAEGVGQGIERSESVKAALAGEVVTNGDVRHDDQNEDENDGDVDDEGEAKNTAPPTESAKDDDHRNRLIQDLFDLLYLHRVLRVNDSENDKELDAIVAPLREAVELDDAALERMQKAAGEYWKRTYLLFGLLGPAG